MVDGFGVANNNTISACPTTTEGILRRHDPPVLVPPQPALRGPLPLRILRLTGTLILSFLWHLSATIARRMASTLLLERSSHGATSNLNLLVHRPRQAADGGSLLCQGGLSRELPAAGARGILVSVVLVVPSVRTWANSGGSNW